MAGILKRTSFGLIRTNPKLTTNIKIVADSKDLIYLESIDANPDLTRSIYKGFKVSPNGSYSYDLKRFYTQTGNPLPASIAYWIFEEDDSSTVKDRYKNQYDFTYGYGCEPKNSKIYSEEFSLFSPLWVERDKIPDYFLIFKIEGPVAVNSKEYRNSNSNINLDTDINLNLLTEDAEYFNENIIKKSKIIKTFDLTENSSIGRYIRNHVNDQSFPESPLYVSMDRSDYSYFSGISYFNGGFTKKSEEIHNEFILTDKTIIENEDFITDGFKRNSVICANILNLEFLFDDTEQEDYKFNRYFGLYVSEVELGKFMLSKERLYEDKDNESSQLPTPVLAKIGDPLSTESSIQYNSKGIKIYPEIGPSGPYSGRLMNWSELQNSRFGYVKDKLGNFYSISNTENWSNILQVSATGGISYDTNYLRIKNRTIDWKNFTGLESPFSYVPVETTEKKGRSCVAFKVTDRPANGDEIRIQYTDPNNLDEIGFVDTHTIDAFNTVPPGKNNGLTFSTQGTIKQITNAIVSAIKQIPIYSGEESVFDVIIIGDEIVIYSKIVSDVWNKLKISFFSTNGTFPFEVSNEFAQPKQVFNYLSTPVLLSNLLSGQYLSLNFTGGVTNPKSRVIVEREFVQQFRDDKDDIFVKTKNGYNRVIDFSLYLEEPVYSDSGEITDFKNYSKYYIAELEDPNEDFDLGSSKKVALYKKSKNTNGYLSIFPIKDFDFDFYNEDYKKLADSSREGLYNWYISGTAGTGSVPVFNWGHLSDISDAPNNFINTLYLNPSRISSVTTEGNIREMSKLQTGDPETSIEKDFDPFESNLLSFVFETPLNQFPMEFPSGRFQFNAYLTTPGNFTTIPFNIRLEFYKRDREGIETLLSDDIFTLNLSASMSLSTLSGFIDKNTKILATDRLIFKIYGYNSSSNPITLALTSEGVSYVSSIDLPMISFSQREIINILGPSSAFATNGEFQSLIGYQDDIQDINEGIFNEYDRLKENTINELALPSRVVPYINKWVYDNDCKDVRENGYRLNTDQAFGYSNFSPDFDQIERTPKFFTHEWYYLQKYPPYMTFEQKLNSYSYFDNDIYLPSMPIVGVTGSTSAYESLAGQTGASANLFSMNEDYFLSYFTRESITEGPTSYPIPREFKYSIFSNGSNNTSAETLFRGVKVEILDRTEFSKIQYNKNTLKYLNSEKYNGYKFSAVLTYSQSGGTQIFCIKNEKWRSVTLIIAADLSDVMLKYKNNTTNEISNFIDRSHLYTLTNQFSINAGGTAFEYDDRKISGLILDWEDVGGKFLVKMGADQQGNAPILNVELSPNASGSYNPLVISDVTSTYNYYFNGIHDVTGTTFKCYSISNLPMLNTIFPAGGANSLSKVKIQWEDSIGIYASPLLDNPKYIGGGYDGYFSVIDSIPFASIQDSINSGLPEIRYISIDKDGLVSENSFVINLIRPNTPIKSSYLRRKALDKTSGEIQIPARILGYELEPMDRLELNPIVRYQGNYSPRFRDLIKFVDLDDIKNEGLDYNNIQILDKLPHIKDNELGKIKNLFYNKVNVENPRGVLYRFLNNSGDGEDILPIYPLLGEIAIDKTDFNIFKSNWDASYYRKSLSSTVVNNVIGTREPKEEKSFFGSKVISIPNEVRIETFPLGVSTLQNFIDLGSTINNVQGSLIVNEKTTKLKTEYQISVYVTKSLEEWLIQDGFADEFIKYIDHDFSFGDIGINDDARLYIRENIFQRYSIKEVIMWEKVWLPAKNVANIDQFVTNLSDAEKSLNGYKISKDFKYTPKQLSSLDFEVIYTIPRDKRTSIAFTVVLEKK